MSSESGGTRERPRASAILIVEDEEAVRRPVVSALSRHGFTVLEAGSAEEALQLAQRSGESIDVLLLDIMLPDSWGTRLAQDLRTFNPRMGVIITSGYAEGDPVMRAGIDGTVPFLKKPFEIGELLEAIWKVLDVQEHEEPGGR